MDIETIIQNIQQINTIVPYVKAADIYVNVINDEMIKQLTEKGYDVEVGLFTSGGNDYEIKISPARGDKGVYINPISEFYKLVHCGEVNVSESDAGIEIYWPDGRVFHYKHYEDLFYQPACSDLKRLIDELN